MHANHARKKKFLLFKAEKSLKNSIKYWNFHSNDPSFIILWHLVRYDHSQGKKEKENIIGASHAKSNFVLFHKLGEAVISPVWSFKMVIPIVHSPIWPEATFNGFQALLFSVICFRNKILLLRTVEIIVTFLESATNDNFSY